MKPTLRDYLTIATALIAILLCGYGIGFLVGERTTQNRFAMSSGDTTEHQNNWESVTLERLSNELKLTPEQRKKVRGEIEKSSRNITRTRTRAVREYRKELLDLHRRIEPELTETQRHQMQESYRLLENSLNKQNQKNQP